MKTKFLLFLLLIGSGLSPVMAQNNTSPAPVVKVPWDGFDLTWMNGNDRRDSSLFKIPYFTPCIMMDNNFTHSFNNPIDHTVVGSTALSRDDEMVISALNLGGDFVYPLANGDNVHARVITQFGERSQVVP